MVLGVNQITMPFWFGNGRLLRFARNDIPGNGIPVISLRRCRGAGVDFFPLVVANLSLSSYTNGDTQGTDSLGHPHKIRCLTAFINLGIMKVRSIDSQSIPRACQFVTIRSNNGQIFFVAACPPGNSNGSAFLLPIFILKPGNNNLWRFFYDKRR